jgi:hypothetical protein
MHQKDKKLSIGIFLDQINTEAEKQGNQGHCPSNYTAISKNTSKAMLVVIYQ